MNYKSMKPESYGFENLDIRDDHPRLDFKTLAIKKSFNSLGRSRSRFSKGHRSRRSRRSYRRGSRRPSIKSFIMSSSGNQAHGLSYVELCRMGTVQNVLVGNDIAAAYSVASFILNSGQWPALLAGFKKFRPISIIMDLSLPALPNANVSPLCGPIQVYTTAAEGAPANYVETAASYEMRGLSSVPTSKRFYFKLTPDSTAFTTVGFTEPIGVSCGNVRIFGDEQKAGAVVIGMTYKVTIKCYAWDPW